MSDPEEFKYDVRVRERMLHKGGLDDGQVKRHLDGLPDLEAQSDVMALQQPALARAEPPAPAPAVEAPVPLVEPATAAAAPPPEPPQAPEPPEPPLEASPVVPDAPAAETESADDDGWGP